MELDQMRIVTRLASLAPSVYNTQPWQFVADGNDLEVHADTARALHYLDPAKRQLHISCGAAVEFARLAVRSLGYTCLVRLAPRADDLNLLATLTIGAPLAATPAELRLIDAIPRRYTDREPYDDEPVPTAVLNRLAGAAAEFDCWLRVLDRPDDRLIAATLLEAAEAAEAHEVDYRDELANWRHQGISADGVPVSASTCWTATEVVSDLPLRDFEGHGRHPRPGGEGAPPRVERDTIMLLGSDSDNPHSWLQTGRALAYLLLELTSAGLVGQPLGPVTDLPGIRTRLGREFDLLGCPQLMLRAGYGHGHPRAGRRDVEETLSVVAAH